MANSHWLSGVCKYMQALRVKDGNSLISLKLLSQHMSPESLDIDGLIERARLCHFPSCLRTWHDLQPIRAALEIRDPSGHSQSEQAQTKAIGFWILENLPNYILPAWYPVLIKHQWLQDLFGRLATSDDITHGISITATKKQKNKLMDGQKNERMNNRYCLYILKDNVHA